MQDVDGPAIDGNVQNQQQQQSSNATNSAQQMHPSMQHSAFMPQSNGMAPIVANFGQVPHTMGMDDGGAFY